MNFARKPPPLDAWWQKVSTPAFVATSLALAGLCAAIHLNRERGFLFLIDHANLLFHEAGHLVYGVFGPTAALYGGTLGQLTVPVVAFANFAWRREACSSSLCAAWFFQNFFNIARYVEDARAQLLPRVGGGGHDWYAILLRWNAPYADQQVGHVLRIVGWAGLGAVWALLAIRWWRDRAREDGHPE